MIFSNLHFCKMQVLNCNIPLLAGNCHHPNDRFRKLSRLSIHCRKSPADCCDCPSVAENLPQLQRLGFDRYYKHLLIKYLYQCKRAYCTKIIISDLLKNSVCFFKIRLRCKKIERITAYTLHIKCKV